MANAMFVDESAFVALNSPIAPDHSTAVALVSSLLDQTVRVVTNEWAIALAASELKEKNGTQLATRFLTILKDGGVKVYPLKEDVYTHAESLFLQHEHASDVSYIDCVQVAFMEQYQITKMFTFKEHMKRMNVLVVPK